MSITIELSDAIIRRLNEQESTNECKTKRIDFLPAGFDEDGAANREHYFDNYTKCDEQHHLTNSLRGYPLIGKKTAVPKHCIGMVLQETRPPLHQDDDCSDRLLRVTDTFDEFTYWNYDKMPSKGDAYAQAQQALAISQELSRPISEDDVKAEIGQTTQVQNAN